MSTSTAQTNNGYRLILFVAGQSPRSRRATSALQDALGDLGIPLDSYEAVDVLQSPEQIGEFGVFATPALIRLADGAEPWVLYGELSDREKLERFLR